MYNFDSIAQHYDRLNRLMTWGMDGYWRRMTVERLVNPKQPQRFLDVATGTGDLAKLLIYKAHLESKLTGIDLSEEMLSIARKKVGEDAVLMLADAESMPFDDNGFDCISVAFGVRNFLHLDKGLSEMYRVLKPGGKMAVLELSVPSSRWILPLYNLYAFHVIPLLGRFFAHNHEAYTYLPQSIRRFPKPNTFVQMLQDVGFVQANYKSFTFGVCTLFEATKPVC